MYKKVKQLAKTSGSEMELFVEGFDLFGSNLLYKIATNPELERKEYTIKDVYRPDLVAKDFYGDTLYESFVILQLGKMSNIKPGTKVNLITKGSLESIMREA